jgi:hypothetical protein
VVGVEINSLSGFAFGFAFSARMPISRKNLHSPFCVSCVGSDKFVFPCFPSPPKMAIFADKSLAVIHIPASLVAVLLVNRLKCSDFFSAISAFIYHLRPMVPTFSATVLLVSGSFFGVEVFCGPEFLAADFALSDPRPP